MPYVAKVKFINNSDSYDEKVRKAIIQALEKIGNNAVSHAKQNITRGVPRNGGADWYRVTGNLRNSITHLVKPDEQTVYIGTNLFYAIYNELGTGVFAADGEGKKGWWVFVPGNKAGTSVGSAKAYTESEARKIVAIMRKKGIDAHMTQGMKPLHFLKKALEDNQSEYFSILDETLGKI